MILLIGQSGQGGCESLLEAAQTRAKIKVCFQLLSFQLKRLNQVVELKISKYMCLFMFASTVGNIGHHQPSYFSLGLSLLQLCCTSALLRLEQ